MLDLEEFSPQYNVIVGRNGSGKSNLFAALQFVLSDEYGSLNADQRQLLLHEGSGKEVFTAFVEIVFDNVDGRFPGEGEEVTIRRAVGAKKDEYYLNGKHATKQDIVNLLESAGFSRSNPYYIVQQGKIQELATMTDDARLELLKEVAGTRVYDERRAESVRIMDESATKKQQVEEMLRTLATRLDELEEERAELLEYQKLDVTRRSLQYAIFEKDRERAQTKLLQVEVQCEEAAIALEEAERDGSGASQVSEEARQAFKTAQYRMQQLTAERDVTREERSAVFQVVAQLRLEVEDATARLSVDENSQGAREKDLAAVEKKVTECNKKLATLEKKLAAAKDEEAALTAELRTQQVRLDELMQREARAAQFKSKKERDAWLKEQAQALMVNVEAQRGRVDAAQKEADDQRAAMAAASKQSETARGAFEKHRKVVQQATEKLVQAQQQRDTASNVRKELWRQEEELRQQRSAADRDLEHAEKQLQASVGRDTAQGLSSMRKVVQDHKIAGVHGPLLELFRVRNEALEMAVDVTGAQSLFHVVVDSDEVATDILNRMHAIKAPGRITFLPLNRLNARQPAYPATEGVYSIVDDALEFDARFKPAMAHVFGRTLVCTTLEQASGFSATHNLDCITLDGDRVDRKGALTGGFLDRRVSRLRMQAEVAKYRAAVQQCQEGQERVAEQLAKAEQDIARHMTAMQKAEAQKEKDLALAEASSEELKRHARAEQSARMAMQDAVTRHQQWNTVLQDLQAQHESLTRQMAAPFSSQLSAAERAELTTLSTAVQGGRAKALEKSSAISQLLVEQAQLQELLSGDLLKRRAELMTARVVLDMAQVSSELEAARHQLQEQERVLGETDERLASIEARLEEATAQCKEAQKATEQRQGDGGNLDARVVRARKQHDEMLNERAVYLRELEGAKRKIREVGAINADEFKEYKNKNVDQLYALLHSTQQELGAYTHVNKKAGEQFVQFVEQRESLMERNAKLDQGQASIQDLITALDARKDEAILRTFKGVAKHFQAVFKQLVPAGEASLTMVTAATGKRKQGQDEATGAGGVQAFVGVRIKATFGGVMGAPQDISALSGGQKSLVALALIFAIQKADPAPFYLMDEVDAALDSSHRAAVAKLLAAQSKEAQYIIATFKQELVQPADHFYKITFANKVSSIRSVLQEEAARVVKDLEKQ